VKFKGGLRRIRAGRHQRAERQTDSNDPRSAISRRNTPYSVFPSPIRRVTQHGTGNWVSRPSADRMVDFTQQFEASRRPSATRRAERRRACPRPYPTSCTQGFSVTNVKTANASATARFEADCRASMKIVWPRQLRRQVGRSASRLVRGSRPSAARRRAISAARLEEQPGQLQRRGDDRRILPASSRAAVEQACAINYAGQPSTQPGTCAPGRTGGAVVSCQRSENYVTNARR